jgi:plastocyanin
MFSRRQFLYLLGVLPAACMTREPDFTVVISPSLFEPASLIVPIGTTVAWHNRTDHVHTVTADPNKAQMPERILLPLDVMPFDSGNLFSGERWVHTFDMAGTYVYFCRYHETEEMLGAITVTV